MRLPVLQQRNQNCRAGLLVICQGLLFSAIACAQPFPSLNIPLFSEPADGELSEPSLDESVTSDVSPFDSLTSDAFRNPGDTADLVLTVRSELLSRFVNRQTVESDDVATRVMEADVRGMQTTTTSVLLNSLDSSSTAAFHIVARGTVTSNTVGLTPQARIATLGSHTFDIIKPVFFDGQRFTTKKAYGSLQARQFPQSVDTIASGLPLFGRIGDRIAWNRVQRRMPASDAIVVRRVADDVLPKVNSGVDRNLAELNRSWRDVRQLLDGLTAPDQIAWNASSTLDSFSTRARNTSISSRAMRSRRLAFDLTESESLVLLLSEEGTNRWLAWRSLAGQTVTDTALQNLVKRLQTVREDPATLTDVWQQWQTDRAEPALFSIRFADVEPLALQFADGQVTVRLQFQILPAVGEPSQMQLVQARLRGQAAADGMWALALTEVTAEPAARDQAPDLYTNLINNAQVVRQLPPTTLPRTIDLREYYPQMPVFHLHRIQSEDGQFRLSLRVIETDEAARPDSIAPDSGCW